MATIWSVGVIGGGPSGLMLARLRQRGGVDITVFERDGHPGERPQDGSLDLHAETGQRAMRLAGVEAELAAAARPKEPGDRLYNAHRFMLCDRDDSDDNRAEIDASQSAQLAKTEHGWLGRRGARPPSRPMAGSGS